MYRAVAFSPSYLLLLVGNPGILKATPCAARKGSCDKPALNPPFIRTPLPSFPWGKIPTGGFTRGTNLEWRLEKGSSSKLPLPWEYECFGSITFNSDCLGNLWPAVIKY